MRYFNYEFIYYILRNPVKISISKIEDEHIHK